MIKETGNIRVNNLNKNVLPLLIERYKSHSLQKYYQVSRIGFVNN